MNANGTAQENESLNDDKIIAPLKESVSEVEKLVRAGVYGLQIVCTYVGSIIENSVVKIVMWKEYTFSCNLSYDTAFHPRRQAVIMYVEGSQ